MSLEKFLQSFPYIKLLNEAWDERILDFFHRNQMGSEKMTVYYGRSPSFFAFLKARSQNAFCFGLLNPENPQQLIGLATLNFRPGHIHRQKTSVCYLGDLRIELHRKGMRLWRDFYRAIIHMAPTLSETQHCRYFQTALMVQNKQSKNTLLNNKVQGLNYTPISPYQMCLILGRWKTLSKKRDFSIQWGKSSQQENYVKFWQEDQSQRLFGFVPSTELEHRLSTWCNFDIQSFIEVRSGGKLLALTSIWDPHGVKQLKVQGLSSQEKSGLRLLSSFPFIQSQQRIQNDQWINILYLNQISFAPHLQPKDKSQIVADILKFVMNSTRKFHVIAYAHFENEHDDSFLSSFIVKKSPMLLCSVHAVKDDKIVDPIEYNPQRAPGFEMSCV